MCAFADSGATAGHYADYYQSQSKYEDARLATGGGASAEDSARFDALARQLATELHEHARVLDVGCGNGGLLDALRRLGFRDLTGMDASRICVGNLLAKGFHALEAVLPLGAAIASTLGEERFDLVVLSHVLEHVYDTTAIIASLDPVVRPNGMIYIEVPDAERYSCNGFPPYYFFDSEHINHFSEKSIRVLSERHGLSIRELGRKELPLSNGSAYPALWAKIARTGAGGSAAVAGGMLFESLDSYLEDSASRMDSLKRRFLESVGDEVPFLVWGAGSAAQRLAAHQWFPSDRLVGVVDGDSRKHGMLFAGRAIQSPDEGLRDLPTDAVVVCVAALASLNIEAEFRVLGCPNRFVSVLDDSLSPS
jgi:SAM-dependent methyltransferase